MDPGHPGGDPGLEELGERSLGAGAARLTGHGRAAAILRAATGQGHPMTDAQAMVERRAKMDEPEPEP